MLPDLVLIQKAVRGQRLLELVILHPEVRVTEGEPVKLAGRNKLECLFCLFTSVVI